MAAAATQTRAPAAAGRLPLILFALAAAALVGLTLIEPAEPYDEGLIVSGAERILHGERLYADFNSGYPPGQFYTVAALFRVFGPSLPAGRIWDSLWRLAIAGAALWLARETSGGKVGLAPLACVAAVAGAAGFRLYPMVAAMLPCVAALACALRGRMLAAGLLLGTAAVYRHDLALCFAVAVLAGCWPDRRAILRVLGGAAAVVVPVAAVLLATVPLGGLRRAFLDFPALNAAARHLPLPRDPFPLLRDLVVPAMIVAFALFDARRSRKLLAPALAAALALLLSLQRLDPIHAFPVVVLCLVLLAARPRPALVAASALLYGAIPLYESVSKLSASTSVPATGIRRAGPVRLAWDEAEAIRYIQSHTAPADAVYCGTTTHSRISYNDAIFSFLADRPRPTRYDMWIPGQTNTAAVQNEIVAALDRRPVRYAVLFDVPALEEPNASSVDTGVHILDDYLKTRYRPVQSFGRYRVLERDR